MNMREIIERALLSTGLAESIGDQHLAPLMVAAVDAVLTAMREPTPEMIEAGERVMPEAAGYSLPEDCPRTWTAMIDQARKG